MPLVYQDDAVKACDEYIAACERRYLREAAEYAKEQRAYYLKKSKHWFFKYFHAKPNDILAMSDDDIVRYHDKRTESIHSCVFYWTYKDGSALRENIWVKKAKNIKNACRVTVETHIDIDIEVLSALSDWLPDNGDRK